MLFLYLIFFLFYILHCRARQKLTIYANCRASQRLLIWQGAFFLQTMLIKNITIHFLFSQMQGHHAANYTTNYLFFSLSTGYLLPRSSLARRAYYYLTEVIFMVSLTVTSWVILFKFWMHSTAFLQLLDDFRHLEVKHFSSWSIAVKAAVVIIPIVVNFVVFVDWNIRYTLAKHYPSWLYPVYLLSFFWLMFLPVVPIVTYSVLGQVILSCLVDNNNSLESVVRKGNEATALREIRCMTISLRRLYSKLEQVLSLPLMCCEVFMTCTYINTCFIIFLSEEMNYSVINYLNIFSNVLQLVTVAMIGNIADNIQRVVSNKTITSNKDCN